MLKNVNLVSPIVSNKIRLPNMMHNHLQCGAKIKVVSSNINNKKN